MNCKNDGRCRMESGRTREEYAGRKVEASMREMWTETRGSCRTGNKRMIQRCSMERISYSDKERCTVGSKENE